MAAPNQQKKISPSSGQQTKLVIEKVPPIEDSKDSVISRFNDFRLRIDQIKQGIQMSPSLDKLEPSKLKVGEDLARI